MKNKKMGSDYLQFIYDTLYTNFTIYHLYMIILSSLVALLTITYLKSSMISNKKMEVETEFEENENKSSGLQAKYKMAKQKLLEKQLSIDRKTVSEDEQRIEQQTLKTVMELLQQQSENESTLTMDELQEQLDMYRM